MDIQAEISWLKAEIEQIEDVALIEMLKRLIQYGKEKQSSHRITLEQYNIEIEQAQKDIEEGRFLTIAQVEEETAKWKEKK